MGLNDDSKTSSCSYVEELPYFKEKYPNKLCSLCNLCERSSLGGGEMLKIAINPESLKSHFYKSSQDAKDFDKEKEEPTNDVGDRKKVVLKQKVYINNELINELDNVGHEVMPAVETILHDSTYLYMHRMCAMWSQQLKRVDEKFIPNIEETTVKSLSQKCVFCQRYGASLGCRMNCRKVFHLPCAAAASCFLIIETFSIFCLEHISQVPYMSVEPNIECRHCCTLGDISKLLMCCTCGAHYHTNCVGLANLPDSRTGWNCMQCCKCVICHQTENSEGRSVKCEQCQKLYHTTCLRPVISSVPKYGWKCNRCRVCSDCGARTPGAGSSSRWHCHYTICDSCYQQRNKGFSCPICHKAYRAASHKEMVKCSSCNKFVHSTCDDEADINAYHVRKEANPDYDYICPACKRGIFNGRHISGTSVGLSDSLMNLSDVSNRDLDTDLNEKDFSDFSNSMSDSSKVKKRIGLKEIDKSIRTGGKMGKAVLGKGNLMNQFGRKRNARGKVRPAVMANAGSSGSELNTSQGSEEDMPLEKKMVFCSINDKFTLMQDVCVMCGSLGTDQEACLIACVQCGQCYHPHCVNVNLSKTMLQKGWRCLDCTVCEGCGQKNDESRLILCDECDVSYHIYCMDPPMDAVPNGNWKCKWCAVCQKCGRTSPKNSAWVDGYLECGPCASQATCFLCSQAYKDNDLIIQCGNCKRWLHCSCDFIQNEEEAAMFNNIEYHCMVCRSENDSSKSMPTKILLSNFNTSAKMSQNPSNRATNAEESTAKTSNASMHQTAEPFETTDNTFWVDGVCVNEHGFNMIRSLTTEIKKKRKGRVEAAIQKEASGNVADPLNISVSSEHGQTDNDNAMGVEKTPTPTYKDGMLWVGEDGSQPEGFSISTNEEGLSILRKKRQRNLQKLGIGGFNVRARGLRKDLDDQYNHSENVEVEKKKKAMRKKTKSKLSESYPAYLQEAFFGKNLLNATETPISFEESDSENALLLTLKSQKDNNQMQQTPTSHINKYVNDHINKKQNIVQEPTPTTMQTIKMNNDISEATRSSVTLSVNNTIREEVTQVMKSLDNVGANSILGVDKQIMGDNLLRHTQMAMTMKLADADMSRNVGQVPHVGDNVSSTYSHVSQVPLTVTGGDSITEDTQLRQTPMHHQPQSQSQQKQQQQQQQPYQLSQRLPYNPHNAMKNPTVATSHLHFVAQGTEDPMLGQIKLERDVMLSQAIVPPRIMVGGTAEVFKPKVEEPVKETAVAGTQKTAEKMRKDEDLGEMATISAVLYANTQHPELKHMFPNWNERCKQILKKWRSLSTEMKAPFLQHAKDNRSVLRLRRSQQEPEKVYFHQKSLKEQEQEKAWKQHQAKSKETFHNKCPKNAFMGDYTIADHATSIVNSQTKPAFDINELTTEQNCPKLSSRSLVVPDEAATSNILTQSFHNNSKKDLSSTTQETHFVNSLLQSVTEPSQPELDVLAKALGNNNKPEESLHLSERNDIFIGDKNWSALPKISETKDKLESDENAGLGDILGGFGEGDDDEILKSLTAEIGDDFNILEYADPELDELHESQNLLSKLEFDENQKNV